MLPTNSIAACVLLAATLAQAGNRAWESTLKLTSRHEIEFVTPQGIPDVKPNGTSVTRRSAANNSKKRWIMIQPGEGYNDLWPKGHIKACFEDKTYTHKGSQKSAEDILRPDIETARELWRNAGLDDKDGWFKFEIIDDKEWCNDRENRHDNLLIQYAGEGVEEMATTPGVPPKLSASNEANTFEQLGARMKLSDSLNMGMQNVVPNYAHEMGHAWGMHHEHQNPTWWDSTYSGTDRDKYFFGTNNWNCKNLKDYDAAEQRVRSDDRLETWEIEKFVKDLCIKRETASHYKFTGGFNYLPITDGTVQWDNTRKEPDYDSIMIYPSTSGAKGDGAGKMKILLKKPNGEDILPISKPSLQDVQGLRKVYAAPKSKASRLLGDKGNSLKSLFDKVRRKDKDSGCA